MHKPDQATPSMKKPLVMVCVEAPDREAGKHDLNEFLSQTRATLPTRGPVRRGTVSSGERRSKSIGILVHRTPPRPKPEFEDVRTPGPGRLGEAETNEEASPERGRERSR